MCDGFLPVYRQIFHKHIVYMYQGRSNNQIRVHAARVLSNITKPPTVPLNGRNQAYKASPDCPLTCTNDRPDQVSHPGSGGLLGVDIPYLQVAAGD